jgi:hypothetical protein
MNVSILAMKIFYYISELLFKHECVIVPGLGGFVANYRPAKIHPVLHTFSPPAKDILFNVRLQANDGVLITHMAGAEGISYDEAAAKIRIEVEQILEKISNSISVEVLKVGTLYRDPAGNLQFEPSKEINYLLSSFGFSDFISPAIQRFTYSLKKEKRFEKPLVEHPPRRMPVAVKRALWLGIPAAAIIVLGLFTMNNIKQWATEYSGFIPGHNSNVKIILGHSCVQQKTLNYSWRKAIVVKQDDNDNLLNEILAVNPEKSENHFFIIGNCFSIKDNAERYVKDLKKKGFDGAGYFLPDKKKLYKAYFSGFPNRTSAEQALKQIKTEQARQAWILEL